MKIAISVPTSGSLPIEFVKCLMLLYDVLQRNNVKTVISMDAGAFIPHTRAKVCGASLDRGKRQRPWDDPSITHIMMIDSDILFEPEQIATLLNRDVDFVSGAYAYKHTGLLQGAAKKYVAGYWDEEFFKKHQIFPCISTEDLKNHIPNLMLMDWVGLGFSLVKTEVFTKIDYPWFTSSVINIANMTDSTSEDVGFCLKVKEAGVKIHLDPTVVVRHLKSYEI